MRAYTAAVLMAFQSVLVFGCSKSPSNVDIKSLTTGYLKNSGVTIQIESIKVEATGKFNEQGRYLPIKIRVKGMINSQIEDLATTTIDVGFDSRFSQDDYGNWRAEYDLIRAAPSDSVIKSFFIRQYEGQADSVQIGRIGTIDEKDKCYPVTATIFVKRSGITTTSDFESQFAQDEYGIWTASASLLLSDDLITSQVSKYVQNMKVSDSFSGRELAIDKVFRIEGVDIIDKSRDGNQCTVICDLRLKIPEAILKGSIWADMLKPTFGEFQYPVRKIPPDDWRLKLGLAPTVQEWTQAGQIHKCTFRFVFERFENGWRLRGKV